MKLETTASQRASCGTQNVLEVSETRKSCQVIFVFEIPMFWHEPRNHVDNCYFCTANSAGHNKKNKNKTSYPNLPSALRPVPHDDSLPIPVPKNLTNVSL